MSEVQKTPNLLSLLEGGQLTKAEVHRISEEYIERMQEGELSPLTMLAHAEFLSQILNNIKERARDIGIDVMYRIGAEASTGVVINGVTLKMKEAGVKYDYSRTEIWNRFHEMEAGLVEKRKEIESFAKNIKIPMDIVDTETGEVKTIYPAQKTSKTTIEVTLKTK